MSRSVNLYARWFLGLKPNDCGGNYRCYRTAILAKLDFDRVRSRGYSLQEEILWCLKRVGPVWRNSDRVRRTPTGEVEDQHERSGKRPANHLLSQHAEPFRTLEVSDIERVGRVTHGVEFLATRVSELGWLASAPSP